MTGNPATALVLYQRAVSAGDAVAAGRLGASDERGAGVPQSPRQAFDWTSRSPTGKQRPRSRSHGNAGQSGCAGSGGRRRSESSDCDSPRSTATARAQRLLGGLFMEGIKVGKDAALAAKWLEAAGEDTTESGRELAILYSRSDTPETHTKGMQLLRLAATKATPLPRRTLACTRSAPRDDRAEDDRARDTSPSEQAAIPGAAEGREPASRRTWCRWIWWTQDAGCARIELIRHLQCAVPPRPRACPACIAFESPRWCLARSGGR